MSQVYWFEKDSARRGGACLFLDRDGVIVEEVNYLHRPDDVRILPGAAALIDAAHRAGWAVGIITNQAGIGRGYYDWSAFGLVQARIVDLLNLGPSPFDFTAACASHPEAVDPFQRVENHSWRKPNAGMVQMAAAALDLDLGSSALVGDQLSDIVAGAAAQIGRLFHVRTGHGHRQRAEVKAFAETSGAAIAYADNLFDVCSGLGWSPRGDLMERLDASPAEL